MSIPKTLDELRRFYVKHRLQHLPGGGAYLTVIQQDAFIDVHEIPRAEFDQIIAAEVAAAERRGAVRALREAAEAILPPVNIELRPDGSEDPADAIYVQAVGHVHDELLRHADREDAA